MVNLLVNDVTITEIPVKLHIKMESSGITIESIPTQAVAPMFLGGGEARVLTGDDFAQYLNLNNLNFKGFSKDAYIKNGQLPAGLWKFSVSVRHFYTNKTISNIGTVTAWITSYKPPVLASPKDGEIAPSNAALPLTFSWQASKHTGGTAAIMYRFEMWERRIEGVPAQTVAASVPPIYTTETAGRYVEIMPATLALEPGMKYCWRVTAFDPSGMVTVENKGESEVRTFQYLEKCPEVCGLTVDIKDDTGYASWEENRMHLGGYNFEFYDDEGTCHKTLWGSSTKTAGIGGEYGKTWHVRVQGLCRSGVEGPWSDWVDFKIPDAFKPLKDENGNTYGCGREVPECVITNFELIDNIQKGDTLEDERGTTKYIIHSATKNEDGSFRGLSYMKLSFWGVKVLGEYNNMKVNTDGVIIGRYAWQSVKSDLLVADPEAIEKWADELALEMAGATYNNTIKDTIVLKYSRGIVPFETIAREGTKYYAVTSDGHKEEITSFINGQKRVMVKDGDGHELVIDKDGNVMGVEEYKKCGGSKALLRENIKEKDSQVTKSGNVKFFGTGDYLFDTYDNYSGKTGYAERFPSIGEGDYRPAYACVESNSKLEIKAAPYANITFKNERGVPVLCKDGILEVTARGDRDTTSIYAYDAENHIVGKVNVLSYDKQTRKICLVPIGDTKAPDASTVKQELDAIFAKLMVDFDVTIGEPIAIQYAKDNIFTHGGSGMIGVYNTDQKAAINKLKERGIDNETVYLFFVNDCKALKANDSPDVVNGYMPRGYQFGFIYNELNNFRTIAHEICHGAFHLKHTFDATDYLAAERTTDNLMDYNDSKTLNHWQWKDIHQPKSVRFKWLQDEEGAEAKTGKDLVITKLEWHNLPSLMEGLFLRPDGKLIWLSLNANSKVLVLDRNDAGGIADFENRAVYRFVNSEGNDTILSEFNGEKFVRYYHKDGGLDYEDILSKAKITANSFNSVNLWSDNVDKNQEGTFESKQWLVVDDDKVVLLYDWIENRLQVINDIKNGLYWAHLSGRNVDFEDVLSNNPELEILTESELFGQNVRDYMNENSPFSLLLPDSEQFIFNLIDGIGTQIINVLYPSLIDGETQECLLSLWQGDEGKYLKNRLANAIMPIIRGEESDRVRIVAHEISSFMEDTKADKFVECFLTFLNRYMVSNETITCMNDFWTENSSIVRGKLSDYEFIKRMLEAKGMKDKLDVAEQRFSSFFHENAVIDKMSDCIVEYALSLCPEVETLDEEGKQNIFKTSAEKTVGVLLYEFATGKGPSERKFTDIDNDCPFVTKYLEGRIREEIINDLKKTLIKEACNAYEDFKNRYSEDGVIIPLELTPGEQLSIGQSVERHFFSNLEQIFIGGAVATIKPTDDPSIINVEIENTTGMRSLFLHITKDIEIPGTQLSNKKQLIITNIIIREDELFN